MAVETGATVLASERAAEADLAHLEELTESMGGDSLFEEYRRADVRFHIGVAEAAHSPRLVVAMTEVQGQMSDLIARIAHPREVLARSNAQHRRIVAMLRRRDTGRAVRLMREHMAGTEHILAGLMRGLAQLGTQVSFTPPPWPLFTIMRAALERHAAEPAGQDAHALVVESSA